MAFIVAADKSISYEPVVFEFPRVIFKSPVPRFIVLDMSISEYLLFPLPLIDSLLASSVKLPLAVVMFADISISTPALSVRSPPELPVAIISL